MGVIAKGIPRGCQGLFTPVSLGYPLSVFNKNSTLKGKQNKVLSTVTVIPPRIDLGNLRVPSEHGSEKKRK